MSAVTPLRRRKPRANFLRGMLPSKVVGVPVDRDTPAECVCPTCRRFVKEAHTDMCPRCAVVRDVRAAKALDRQRHDDAVAREIAERDARPAPELDPLEERARRALIDAGWDV